MIKEEIIEGNLILAVYDGYTQCTDPELLTPEEVLVRSDGKYVSKAQLKYYKSWNWLIPIYSKIIQSQSYNYNIREGFEEAIACNEIDWAFEILVKHLKNDRRRQKTM